MSIDQAVFSPRIEALRQDISAGKAGVLEEFWREATLQTTPLIELVDRDTRLALVTFLWRDANSAANPALISSLAFPVDRDPMTHIAETDVWFKTYQAP